MTKTYIRGVMSMDEIKRAHVGYFFEKSTMRFFNSRLAQYDWSNGTEVFFVTSERFDEKNPRLYTVRKMSLLYGHIETVGEFQQYRNNTTATYTDRRLAGY